MPKKHGYGRLFRLFHYFYDEISGHVISHIDTNSSVFVPIPHMIYIYVLLLVILGEESKYNFSFFGEKHLMQN